MTTRRQVEKLVKPLLARHSDLALVGRMLIVRPVRHIHRVMAINSSSSADWFHPEWLITHYCVPRKQIPFYFMERLRPERGIRWLWNEPAMPEAFYDVFENQALPLLRNVVTFDDLLSLKSKEAREPPLWDYVTLQELTVHLARGDLDSARKICRLITEHPVDWSAPQWNGIHEAIIEPLCSRLRRDDFDGLTNLLRDWEFSTVQALKLDKLWEPTQFPLEVSRPPIS